MSNFESVFFTGGDYMHLCSLKHPLFDLGLPAISAENENFTVDGQPISEVLSIALFKKIDSLDPIWYSAYTGSIIFTVQDPFRFLQSYNELMIKNKSALILKDGGISFSLIESVFNVFIFCLDKNKKNPSLENCKCCYDLAMNKALNKAKEIYTLPHKEQIKELKLLSKKFEECYKASCLMEKTFENKIRLVKVRIEEVIDEQKNEFEEENWFYILDETPTTLAIKFNRFYSDLKIIKDNFGNKPTLKCFVNKSLIHFREQTKHIRFNQKSFLALCSMDNNGLLKKSS